MKGRYAVSLLGLTVSLVAHSARADDGSCGLRIEADRTVRTRWPDLTQRLHQAFDLRDDIDRCAQVQLTPHDSAIEVRVTLPDGRSAMRSAAQRDVMTTLEALLVLPDPAVDAPPSTQGTVRQVDPGSPSPPVEAPVAAPQPRAARSPLAPAARRQPLQRSSSSIERGGVGFEVSVVTGARIGQRQMSLGLGVVSLMEIEHWLVGFEARADGYRELAGPRSMPAVDLALLGGHRAHLGSFALDVTLGPALALLAGNESVVVAASSSRARPEPAVSVPPASRGFAPRLLIATRLHFGTRSLFRTFVGADAAFGPKGDAVQELPVWMLGLALGATVGTR